MLLCAFTCAYYMCAQLHEIDFDSVALRVFNVKLISKTLVSFTCVCLKCLTFGWFVL